MLKQILSYIVITERVTGEVRLSLCSVVSISLRCCFLKDPNGTVQANPARVDSLLILLLTGIIRLEPGSPNYGLRAFCAGGPVSHRTPLPSAARSLSSANSASQNFLLLQPTCSQEEYFPLPHALSPEGQRMTFPCRYCALRCLFHPAEQS